jgi:hypothetical protein
MIPDWIDAKFADWGFTKLGETRRIIYVNRSEAQAFVVIAELIWVPSGSNRFRLVAGLASSEKEIDPSDPWQFVSEHYIFRREAFFRQETFPTVTVPRWLAKIEHTPSLHLDAALSRMEIFFLIGDSSLSPRNRRLILGPFPEKPDQSPEPTSPSGVGSS